MADAARALLEDTGRARTEVHRAVHRLRADAAREELGSVPVARLKDVTGGRLRLGALEKAGYSTVRQILDTTPYTLQLIPGIGAQTAAQVHAAAQQIARAAEESVAVRIDFDRQDPDTTALLIALHPLVNAGPELLRAHAAAAAIDRRLSALLPVARPARNRLRMLFTGAEKRRRAGEAVEETVRVLAEADAHRAGLLLAQASADLLRPPVSEVEAWVDFEYRAADYHNVLTELAAVAPDRIATEGFLPAELAERVNAQPLDDTHRRVSLRGYQAFGARFALAQRRVILGDEMGLGKTIQAIAALAHLKAAGRTHFLVACPASVLINWLREIEERSALKAFRVHGPDRDAALAEWIRTGDVAVTTIDSLHRLTVPGDVPEHLPIGMLIVDEAHFVKNPEARRSRAVAEWCARTDRVLFLTGTPMENRVEEFRNLVAHLRPGLLPQVDGSQAAAGANAFRKAVAPAYLRRNQQDVLTELPDLVHVDEWEEFSQADAAAYSEAVAAENFMAMRRAAFAVPERSAKLRRLLELVEEAAANELKVVIFSYFRDVLSTVHRELQGDGGARSGGDGTVGDRSSVGPTGGGRSNGGRSNGGRLNGGRSGGGRTGGGRAGGARVPGRAAPAAFGPISGDVSATRRQELVDEFAAAPGHAVLLSQIQAGGVGLNMQAASVVILCEPQVKPTMESQAVARAHRMGQVRKVQVHRLLAADSVDQRMLEILHTKSRLFDAYARRSDLAESTPDAIDVSEQTLARQIIQIEQERLAGRPPSAGAAS